VRTLRPAVRLLAAALFFAPLAAFAAAPEPAKRSDPIRLALQRGGHIARGRVAEHEKDLAGVEAAYRKASESDPRGTAGPIALAAFYGGQKRWAEARAIFEGRLAAEPDDAFAIYQLGRLAYFSGEDLEKGVSCFERYLALPVPEDGPTHADARWRKGLLLEKLGKTPAAIAEYREALKADPAHRGARRELERLKAV
jgi:tetratricopeptide (TPR) repeat protein